METKKMPAAKRQEDMTPEEVERWLTFYRAAMQRKRETLAEHGSVSHEVIMRSLFDENE